MEHHGIEAHSSTAPQTQKQNQTETKIPSTADRWIQAKANLKPILADHDDGTVLVIAVDPQEPLDEATPSATSATLARVIAPTLTDHDLVLTGGETARRVLDALGEHALYPVVEIHRGAILSVTRHGRAVATRPGSFGGDSSLLDMITAVQQHRAAVGRTNYSNLKGTTHP